MRSHADVIWAVVPIKDFASGKSRLAAALSPVARAQLACAMAEDVLAALHTAQVAQHVCVLSDSAAVSTLAVRNGATWLDEKTVAATPGLNSAVAGAARVAAADAATALLVVHADLPLLTANAIQRVVDTWRHLPDTGRVVLARSRDGGTNILLAERPEEFTYHYGAGSHARHVDECARLHRVVANVEMPATVLDVDTLDDLEMLKDAARAGTCGSHTAALLSTIDPTVVRDQMEAAP
ncbi:2-phospho-L-lactate guanylyltransferase [Paraburkholderia rhynchosiae]|uniref:3-phospho-D-glycerate guanylyltransferase n=1 Tax=Paraburkholderia rhynchosiae TaxID=487049 RepID=A0ABX4UVX8_9BURK|nr:2-phospho-L-lactate guanylyltransferase [Paraburkholderia rhynchosiae]PMS24486.1 2-phospho-L-lactate guanylyltransferase [Paraburkholderia rhynchosiae]